MPKVKEEVEVIDTRDKVTVYATSKAPHHKAGEAVEIHPNHKEKYLKAGWFTEEPAKEKEPAKSK